MLGGGGEGADACESTKDFGKYNPQYVFVTFSYRFKMYLTQNIE